MSARRRSFETDACNPYQKLLSIFIYCFDPTGMLTHNLILCFVDCAPSYNLANKPNYLYNLLSIFISLLYMFRENMCPSSRENYCIYATLVFVTLYGWRLVCWLEFLEFSLQPADQMPPTQSDEYQCRIGTVSSSDDGHMFARNM